MIMERIEKWLTSRRSWMILAAAAGIWFLFTASMTILRYRLNYASAYDFGIFSQMYYYMDKGLTPLTTCERDGLLSHFAVHLPLSFMCSCHFTNWYRGRRPCWSFRRSW